MKIFGILLLTAVFAILFHGCCGVVPDNELNTTISPAKDLTGTWKGTASFQENVEGAQCNITGNFRLVLQQNGNNLQGDFVFSHISINSKKLPGNYVVPPIGCSGPVGNTLSGQVDGTVSSSSLKLNMGGSKQFSGSFTGDIMSLKLERCLVNDEPCTLSNGAQWKITLTRQS